MNAYDLSIIQDVLDNITEMAQDLIADGDEREDAIMTAMDAHNGDLLANIELMIEDVIGD